MFLRLVDEKLKEIAINRVVVIENNVFTEFGQPNLNVATVEAVESVG